MTWKLIKELGAGKYEIRAEWSGRKPTSADLRYVIAGRKGRYMLVKTAEVIRCENNLYYTD